MRSVKWIALLLLCSTTVYGADKAKGSRSRVRPVSQVGDGAAEQESIPTRAPVNSVNHSHAYELQADGTLRGQLVSIDPATLQEVPAGSHDVIFVQNGRVISSVRSDQSGNFIARGLTGQAAYSVFVRGSQWLSGTGIAVLSHNASAGAPQAEAVTRFSSLKNNANNFATKMQPSFNLSVASNADAAAAGGFPQGFVNTQMPFAPSMGFPPGGGVPAGGGGTGGGGGGGLGGGLGPLAGLGALGAAIGIAAGNNDRPAASPF